MSKKVKKKSASPLPRTPLLRRPAPALYFHPFFLKFFLIPPSGGGKVINIYSPLLFKKKRGGPNYELTPTKSEKGGAKEYLKRIKL